MVTVKRHVMRPVSLKAGTGDFSLAGHRLTVKFVAARITS